MKVVIGLLVATLLVMVLGAVTVLAGEVSSPDAPTGSSAGPNVSEIIEKESISADEDAQSRTDWSEYDTLPPVAWEAAVQAEVEGKIDLNNLWRDPPIGSSLLYRLSVAVLRSRTVPAGKNKPREVVWQKCGVEVPKEDVVRQAGEWAFTFLAACDRIEKQTGIKLPVWGVFASHANEGGFDPCALDFPTRKWASEHAALRLTCETWKGNTSCRKISRKLVEKFGLSYDAETVWTILHDSYYPFAKTTYPNGKEVKVAGKSDLGPWQIRTSVKKLTREQFDRLMSMVPGVFLGAQEMARRALAYSYRYRVPDPHPRPWMLWPGWNPNTPKALLYDSKVTSVARWLGARRDEIERGFVVINTSGKKHRYTVTRIK